MRYSYTVGIKQPNGMTIQRVFEAADVKELIVILRPLYDWNLYDAVSLTKQPLPPPKYP
jgi:hypothetical protein